MPLRNKSGEEFYGPQGQRTFKPDGGLPSLVPASSQGVFLLPWFGYLLCHRACSGGRQLAPGSYNSSPGTR